MEIFEDLCKYVNSSKVIGSLSFRTQAQISVSSKYDDGVECSRSACHNCETIIWNRLKTENYEVLSLKLYMVWTMNHWWHCSLQIPAESDSQRIYEKCPLIQLGPKCLGDSEWIMVCFPLLVHILLLKSISDASSYRISESKSRKRLVT